MITNIERAENYVRNIAFRSLFIIASQLGWKRVEEIFTERLIFLQTEPDMRLRWSLIHSSASLGDFQPPVHQFVDDRGYCLIDDLRSCVEREYLNSLYERLSVDE